MKSRFLPFAIAAACAAFGALLAAALPEPFLLFLGRFHPVIVHLPIGFLVALLLVEILAKRLPEAAGARSLLLGGGCVTLALAAVAGFYLAREGGYDEARLQRHQWLGIGAGVLSLAAFGLAGVERFRWGYRGTFAAGLAALTLAGHDGASLTHGPDYLTGSLSDAAPAPLEPSFARDVLPVIRAKCISCHGPDRQEGKLRLDVIEGIRRGGESGRPAVIPGDLSASYLAELITLPRNAKGAMPPKDAPQLTREEIRKMLHWIHFGAPGGDE